MRLSVMGGCLTAGVACCGVAAQAGTLETIRAVVEKNRALPEYRKSVEQNVAAFEAGQENHCKDIQVNWTESHVRLLREGTILADGHADGTQWEEGLPERACGESRMFRMLVLLREGQEKLIPLLPGDGWAGPLLEHDTMLQVTAAAATYTRQNCPVHVVNTHLTSGHPDVNAKAVWTELWTVHSCGKHFGVPITFVPDAVGQGTSMSVNASKIVTLP